MTEVELARIKVGPRFREDPGDVASLAASIRAVGLLHPIVISHDLGLITGARRLAACRALGIRKIPVTIVSLNSEARLRAELDENACRLDFTPSEMVAIKRAVEDRLRTPQHVHEDGRDRETFAVSGRTFDKAAAIVGVSGRTLEKAEAVVVAAEADPAFAPVVAEMDRTGRVDPAYRQVTEATRQAKATAKRRTTITDSDRVEIVRSKLSSIRSQYSDLALLATRVGCVRRPVRGLNRPPQPHNRKDMT